MRLVRRSSQSSEAVLPIQSFEGHVNAFFRLVTYSFFFRFLSQKCAQACLFVIKTLKGLAVDPSENFLFAAGDDNVIRAWSFHTGRRLQPPLETDWSGLLTRKFPSPVHAMQITSEGHTNTLWVASGTKLECFQLGKRRSPDTSKSYE